MNLNRTLQYLNKLKKPHKTAIKISWLHPDETVFKEFTNEFYNINGSLSVNYKNGARRSCTITIHNFPVCYNTIWLGQKFQLWTGLYLDDECTDPYYISQGIFYIKNPKETYNPNTQTLTLQGVDKWAYLDGSLFGKLTGTYKSLPNQDIMQLVQGLLKQSKYSNTLEPATNIVDRIDVKDAIFDGFNLKEEIDTVQYVTNFNENEELDGIGCLIYKNKDNDLVCLIDGDWCYCESTDKNGDNKDEDDYPFIYTENKVKIYSWRPYSAWRGVSEGITPFTRPVSRFAQPYTATMEIGKSFGDIMLEYNTMLMGRVFYDREGYLRFEPVSTSIQDYSDKDREIAWHFTVTEQEFLGINIENKFDSVYNDVIVLGAVTAGKQAKARVQNRDPLSETAIDRIGVKTREPYQSDQYYSDEQCLELAQYYASLDMAMERAGTISSLAIYHLDVGQIVTVSTPSNDMSQEQFLVTGFSHSLSDNKMSITVTNLRNFIKWTPIDENGDIIE